MNYKQIQQKVRNRDMDIKLFSSGNHVRLQVLTKVIWELSSGTWRRIIQWKLSDVSKVPASVSLHHNTLHRHHRENHKYHMVILCKKILQANT